MLRPARAARAPLPRCIPPRAAAPGAPSKCVPNPATRHPARRAGTGRSRYPCGCCWRAPTPTGPMRGAARRGAAHAAACSSLAAPPPPRLPLRPQPFAHARAPPRFAAALPPPSQPERAVGAAAGLAGGAAGRRVQVAVRARARERGGRRGAVDTAAHARAPACCEPRAVRRGGDGRCAGGARGQRGARPRARAGARICFTQPVAKECRCRG